MITLYGIPNCDTMKKARKWLAEHGIEYRFHDYRKDGLERTLLSSWVEELGWEALLNRRGMMWRKLDPGIKTELDQQRAIDIMLKTPSIIKRPLLDTGKSRHLGFSDQQYQAIFDGFH
ncbi:MAG: ArsC family reductase [Chromatiales bacterium]|jgi:Spx/MgsR family transcriptional regulator